MTPLSPTQPSRAKPHGTAASDHRPPLVVQRASSTAARPTSPAVSLQPKSSVHFIGGWRRESDHNLIQKEISRNNFIVSLDTHLLSVPCDQECAAEANQQLVFEFYLQQCGNAPYRGRGYEARSGQAMSWT